jgi:hypothetical protein
MLVLSTLATDLMTRELDGQDIAIRETADPIAVVRCLGDLKSARPITAEMPADFDGRTDLEVQSG